MASPSDTCSLLHLYPQPGKPLAVTICEAFAEGARQCGIDARVVTEMPARLLPGMAAFYGVRPGWRHLWDQAIAEGRRRFYIDRGFFDRERHFRVAVNRIQAAQCGPAYDRLHRFNLWIHPWRTGGRTAVVALQSDEFMASFAGGLDLVRWVKERWPQVAESDLVVRRKGDPRPLGYYLNDAARLVTWSSNVAVEAVVYGVPVVTLGESVAAPFARDRELWPDRHDWAARLAASQWMLEELKSGLAWRALSEVRA